MVYLSLSHNSIFDDRRQSKNWLAGNVPDAIWGYVRLLVYQSGNHLHDLRRDRVSGLVVGKDLG